MAKTTGKPAVKMASVLLLSGALCAGSSSAGVAIKEPAAPATEGYAATSGEPQAQARIVRSFSGFAGSEANARNLVTGLRQSSEITLIAPAAGGQPGTATRFTPPTRPMDYGNVRISLALAREQLAQLGVDRPTPTQIKAVLAGGGVASHVSGRATTPFLLPGVLQMRAGGMGWAKIADTMGVRLGPAMSGKTHHVAFAPPPASLAQTAASAATGIISVAVASTDVPARRNTDNTPPLVTSASITTSTATATGARTAAVARQRAPARRPADGEPGPENRRSRTSVIAAADSTVKGAGVTMPVQYGVNSAVVMMDAATEAPGAAGEPVRLEDGQAGE